MVAAGQIIRAADFPADVLIVKGGSESVQNNTLQDDDHILLTLPTWPFWKVEFHGSVTGPAAADFKMSWVATDVTQVTTRDCVGPATSSTDVTNGNMRCSRHNLSTAVTYGTDGSAGSAIVESFLVEVTAASGTLQLQWAQNTTTASNTTVSTNTWVRASPLRTS